MAPTVSGASLRGRSLGELLACTSLLLYSVNSLITKVGVGRVSVNVGFMVAVAVNILFAALLLAGQLLLQATPLVWNWPGFFFFVLAGICTTLFGRFFYYEAVANFGPARASVYQLAIPVFSAALAALFLGERLGPLTLLGGLITMLGLFIAVYVPGSFRSATTAPRRVVTGSLYKRILMSSATTLCLTGSFSYGVGNLMRGAAVQRWDEPVLGALVGAGAALLALILSSADARRALTEIGAANRTGVLLFVVNGTLNISAQMTGIMALRYIEVAVASLIASCVPILVIPLSWLFLRRQEHLSLRLLAGALVATGGVALIVFGRRL